VIFWHWILTSIALAALFLAWRRLHPSARLEICERGILDRSLGLGWIPWDEIEGAYPPRTGESETVRLRLRVTDRLTRALRSRRRGPAAGPSDGQSVEIPLDLHDSDLDAVEVLQQILSNGSSTPALTGLERNHTIV
jgi:hypothetical protein